MITRGWIFSIRVTKQDRSNSYYPPGTVCAVEKDRKFCPTGGESGSPLMITDDKGRMVAEGIQSFTKVLKIWELSILIFFQLKRLIEKQSNKKMKFLKSQGCSEFYFAYSDSAYSYINQRSYSPVVYTKLSCFLPWVAAQYDMSYTPPGDPDPACLTGNGNITEVTAEVCRSNPFNNDYDRQDGIEAPCLFPFTLNGKSYNTCILDEIEDFTRPVFRCPIRTLKGVGTNYTDFHHTGGGELGGYFCPTNR